MLAPSTLGLDAADGSTANGTNIRLYASSGANAQKFRIAKKSDGYLITGLASGKALDVADGAVATEDANIQLWTSNDTAAQRWKIALSATETATIGGVKCSVGTIGAGNAGAYVADVESALAQSKTNVRIHHANQTTAQNWAFVPTTAISDDMPVPYDMALASSVGSLAIPAKAGLLHPRFRCAYASGATYQWRYRSRKLAPSGIWGAWTAWTAWAAPSGTSSARASLSSTVRNVWLTDTVDCRFDFSSCKQMQVQMEVRTVSADGALMSRACSAYEISGSSAVKVAKNVNTTFTGAYWSPLGLRVECSNDYQNAGELTYDAMYMQINGGAKWKNRSSDVWENGSFLVSQTAMGGIPAEGDKVRFLYYTWQDMESSNNTWQQSPTLTVAYDGGTVDVTPTITDGDGATMVATVPYVQTVRMWVMVDGEMLELSGTEADGKTTFTYEYPFGKDYKLFTAYASDDGGEWGTDETDMPARSLRAHAWNWDGGYLVLWLDEDYVKESREYGLSTDVHTLAGRSKPAVSILADSNGDSYLEISGSVSGVLLPDDRFGCTVESVESLLKQGFARYRGPFGRIADVAVTGGSVETGHWFTSVSIDQTEVSS